tara:strand:+ start:930 stop:1541 length:612 start_codon:yes stop_codon:yes gene_type:complete
MIKDFELRDDFIGIFYSDINCSQYIDFHKRSDEANNIIRRRNVNVENNEPQKRAQLVQDDLVTIDTTSHMLNFNRNVPLLSDYNNLTSQAMDLYVQRWNSVANFDFQQAYMNIQKTSKSQGYHVWHYEDGPYANNRRMFATMLYLNDVEEGGETEFLYQSLRVKPERGKFLIWPAQWMHTHRGNPPLSGEKYIITSWIENTEL